MAKFRKPFGHYKTLAEFLSEEYGWKFRWFVDRYLEEYPDRHTRQSFGKLGWGAREHPITEQTSADITKLINKLLRNQPYVKKLDYFVRKADKRIQ